MPVNQSLKVPPHSLEAEKGVLGSVLIDKDAVIKVADFIHPEDFYYEKHGIIFEAVMDLFNKRSPVDLLTLSNVLEDCHKLELIGGSTYLAELTTEVPTASHVMQYATIIKRKATLRKLIKAGDQISGIGFNEEDDIEEIVEKAEQSLFAVTQTFIRDKFVAIKDILSDAYERIAELHDPDNKGHTRGIPTGFKSLDRLISGLQPSDMVVVAGRPSMGKTALSLNMAQNVAKFGKSVGIISLEMSKEQLVERMFCALLGVDSWKMRTGQLSDEDFKRIGPIMDELNTQKIFIDDSSGASMSEMRAKARRLQMEHGLDVLMIDYLQLISLGKAAYAANRVQEMSEISRSIKALARELHIPIIALSQLSRAVEQRPGAKIPQLSDLRESGCLTGDTLIMRADTGEHIHIKNLVGQTNIPVMSLEEDFTLQTKTISKIFPSGKKQIYELKLRSGKKIKASGNHPFLTIYGWRALDRLKIGQHLAVPRKLTMLNVHSEIKNEELILLAHLIGDGCVLPKQPVHYTSADPQNRDIVAKTAFELFNIKPRIVKQKNWWHVYLPSPYHLTHGKKHPITNWYSHFGVERVRSYDKVIPQAVIKGSIEQIRLFLHHLWATDGNISWKITFGKSPAGSVYYSTSSQQLALQVQHLLLRLGITSTIRTVPQGKHRPNHQVHIQGAAQQYAFCSLVGSYGQRGIIAEELLQKLPQIVANPNTDIIPKEAWRTYIQPAKERAGYSWRQFSSKIDTAYCGTTLFKSGLSRSRMESCAQAVQSPTLLQLAQSDIYWDEIAAITPLGIEEVYDATVPCTHNFLANDIIVHNSIEQDADIVMMIYREDYYEEDSDRKGVTDLYIRKHRNGPTGHIELMFRKEQMKFFDIDRQHRAPDRGSIPSSAFIPA